MRVRQARNHERAACGVGFIASLHGRRTHGMLQRALAALRAMEHRGACAADGTTGDGAGVMTDIPWDVLGHEPGAIAIATLFLSADEERRSRALRAFEETFAFLRVPVLEYRTVPTNPEVLGPIARKSAPRIVQAVLRRPEHSRNDAAFDALLYQCKQATRVKLREIEAWHDLFFVSLSTSTVVYKALCRSAVLDQFYPDLGNPRFTTRFCLFHRRFSTNTRTSWDKAQPFRVLAHNGEINTVTGNRSSAFSREHAMGLSEGELLTHSEISDSGSLGEIVEALKYRSAMAHLENILAIAMPPAAADSPFYEFWGRAMEPWDGPALVVYGDGDAVGARLDRNGFRPARWCMTDELVALASEAGVFGLDEGTITRKGTLAAGNGVDVVLRSGRVHFRDPSESRENRGATFDPRLIPLDEVPDHLERRIVEQFPPLEPRALDRVALFGLTVEELDRVLVPMIVSGKEPIGSMGDTARPAAFSDEARSFYDFFVQRFAQVTNPPLDYLREGMVTDLRTYLGVRPNVFSPKELIPVAPGIELERPVLTLQQMQVTHLLSQGGRSGLRTLARTLDCTFDRREGPAGLEVALRRLAQAAQEATRDSISVIILSDREAKLGRLAVPSLLALRAVVCALNDVGARVHTSVVLEAGDVRTTHQVACAIGFGATAVCPYVALELARFGEHPAIAERYTPANEQRLVDALCAGLLKVMSKMGISVVRSYHSSKLFAAYGLGPRLTAEYFDGVDSPLGGYELHDIGELLCRDHDALDPDAVGQPRPSTFQLKEKNKGDIGERHSMTAARSKLIHDLVRGRLKGRTPAQLESSYLEHGRAAAPVSPRHLLALRPGEQALPLGEVEDASRILARFGSGAMSFGAISAEAQRDIFVAMRRVGGRCNSGEGGENPYYFVDGTTATTKQIASGRFGVDAEYLVHASEIEIKIAQGAKPGEGGQLMGVKVDEHIARARHASVGVDLISPPPLHDIYSIEDLKQLIYELKQLRPDVAVCVKLVAGAGIGTIAAGVVKAGADVIQISGTDGGTGAATVSSMKHAGWPWELGLLEVHRNLVDHGLRTAVRLRVDGGLANGEDVVLAAALGAEEFGFGKLLLVAQGCIMARVCEKNRCPTGIATHDPKFKAKYKGTPEHVEAVLRMLAQQVREHLAYLGVRSLAEVVGQRRFVQAHPEHRTRVEARRLDLSPLLEPIPYDRSHDGPRAGEHNAINRRLIDEVIPRLDAGQEARVELPISNRDRAAVTGLAGVLAERSHRARMRDVDGKSPNDRRYYPDDGHIELSFTGSSGQGFCAFTVPGVEVRLAGEANDSVAKSMSGGRVVIVPPESASFDPHENTIIGNAALYGATGGTLFVHGRAGDRFAVRNSGAQAVVEGTGLHACEYMTGGTVVILGSIGSNAGAGMTGGALWLPRSQIPRINAEYVTAVMPDELAVQRVRRLLRSYAEETRSEAARRLVDDGSALTRHFACVLPVRDARRMAERLVAS